jgi:hypothetical protein
MKPWIELGAPVARAVAERADKAEADYRDALGPGARAMSDGEMIADLATRLEAAEERAQRAEALLGIAQDAAQVAVAQAAKLEQERDEVARHHDRAAGGRMTTLTEAATLAMRRPSLRMSFSMTEPQPAAMTHADDVESLKRRAERAEAISDARLAEREPHLVALLSGPNRAVIDLEHVPWLVKDFDVLYRTAERELASLAELGMVAPDLRAQLDRLKPAMEQIEAVKARLRGPG